MIVRITKGSRYSVSIITDDVLRTYDYVDGVEFEAEYYVRKALAEALENSNETVLYIEAWGLLLNDGEKRIVRVFL